VSPRERRLRSDLRQMQELAAGGQVLFRTEGEPPETYHLMLTMPGLCTGSEQGLQVRGLHRCEIYLHLDYPRRPPAITWLTPIFHPNILGPDRNGGVCIGSWSAGESLADLCWRLGDLVTYRALNPADALNLEASAWALRHAVQPGTEVEQLKELPLAADLDISLGGV
jgi:ubiquitin-protein ligase